MVLQHCQHLLPLIHDGNVSAQSAVFNHKFVMVKHWNVFLGGLLNQKSKMVQV